MLSSHRLWPASRSVSVGESVMGGSLLVRDDVPSRDESVNVAALAAASIQAQSPASVYLQRLPVLRARAIWAWAAATT